MRYEISQAYCWYEDRSQIVLMYFINHVPFTFDELPESASSSEKLMRLADQQLLYTTDDLYRSSYYLILEECHPLMFDLDLKNPEDLPKV